MDKIVQTDDHSLMNGTSMCDGRRNLLVHVFLIQIIETINIRISLTPFKHRAYEHNKNGGV